MTMQPAKASSTRSRWNNVYRLSFVSIEQARREIFWFIEAYYNLKRKHSTLGYKSPVKFEIAALQNAA